MRISIWLMVQLGENSPYRGEHRFLFQTKVNSVLLSEIRVGKLGYINSGITLISVAGTSIEQLEKISSNL